MKYNPLISGFPTEYMGMKINTDFRVILTIYSVFNDGGIAEDDKKQMALKLFYGDIPLNIKKAWDGLEWFLKLGDTHCVNSVDFSKEEKEPTDMSGILGDELEQDSSNDDSPIDFDFDATRIYTAFLRTYNMDLIKVPYLHYFAFSYMLSDISEGTSLSKVIEYRTEDLRDKKGKERTAYLKMKKLYGIPKEISESDKKHLETLGIDEDDLDMYMQ